MIRQTRVFQKSFHIAALGYLALMLGLASASASYSGLCLTGQGCRAISQTPLSVIFGISLWWWGALWLSAVVMMDLWRKDWPWLTQPLKAAAIIGFIASLGLPAAGFSMTGSFCSWCLVSNALFCWISLKILLGKPTEKPEGPVKEGPSYAVMFGGLILMLSVPFWPVISRCRELSQKDMKHLRAAVGGDINEDMIFVFTDPACGHCQSAVPGFVKKAREAGKSVVALWSPIMPASKSGEVCMYGSIAHWQGYGESFMMNGHGTGSLENVLKVAIEEFPANNEVLLKARGVIMSNMKLFQEMKLKGTPSFARVKDGRLCADLDARQILK